MPSGKNQLDRELFITFGITASFKWLPVTESGISRTEWQQPIEIALMSKPRGGGDKKGIRDTSRPWSHWHDLGDRQRG